MIVAICAGLAVVAASAHSKGRRWVCRPGGGDVVTADARAKVYLKLESFRYGGSARVYFACAYGRHRTYVIGTPPVGSNSSQLNGGGTRQITLRGTVIAYETSNSINTQYGSEGETVVYVRQLRSGRLLHEAPTGTPNPPNPLQIGIGSVTSLVVRRDGAVAWIVKCIKSEGSYQVHAVDGSGSRELAVGPDIAPYSLALAGGTLYWTQGGQPMAAKLE